MVELAMLCFSCTMCTFLWVQGLCLIAEVDLFPEPESADAETVEPVGPVEWGVS